MKEVHFEGKVAQKAVIVRDGRVLIIRDPRIDYEIWELPGGRLNLGETPKVGLEREIKEELGLDIVVGPVVHVAQFLQGNEQKPALMIAYEATVDSHAEVIMSPEEVSEVRFVTKAEVNLLKFFPEYTETLEIYFAK